MELRDKNGLTEAEFLAQYRPHDYPRPSFTADTVVLSGARAAAKHMAHEGLCKLQILLIKRGGHPFLGCWALPGGFVNPTEDADTAASRELEEETGVAQLPAERLGVYSAPGRDPRGWTITAAYLACVDEHVAASAGDDAAEALWCDLQVASLGDGIFRLSINARGDALACTFAATDESCTVKRAHVAESSELAFDHANIIADACVRALGLREGR